MCNVGRQTMRPASVLAALLSLSFCAWGQISSCDLNGDGVVDSADVALAVNMALGTASCTANIEGPSTCTLVTVQRVTKASQGRGCVVYNSSSITSPTTASATVGNAFSYRITAANTPSSTYSATGLPDGLSINSATGLISGTPTSAGTATVTVTATSSRSVPSETPSSGAAIATRGPESSGTASASLTLTISSASSARKSSPVITSATSASGTVGSAFSYQITATNSPTSYSATGLPAGLSVNTATGSISGTPTGAGTSTVTLGATNGSAGSVRGGGTGSATLTLTIAPAGAPVITSATSVGGTVGSTFSYQITATNSPTSYSATGLPAGLSVNTATGLISGTPTSGGLSTVTLGATNAGGTGRATLTLTIAAAAPVITSATSASGTVGSAFSYQITATNSPTSYSATGLPAGLSVNTATGLISGTPTSGGLSTVTLGATNSGGTGNATLTLTITVAHPVITSATSAGGTVGSAFSYQIAASNSPTSYSATGLPAGLSVNTTTGLISGTATTAGTSTVTLGATNASGTGNATLTLTITLGAPVITSATSAGGTVGSAFSYQITATNSPTSYSAAGLPAGLSVNSATGLISGTPTASGTSTVTLGATNSGGAGNATLTLTIAAAGAPAPVITSATSASGTVGSPFSYQITATNSPTSYAAAGLPAGLALTNAAQISLVHVTSCGPGAFPGAVCTIPATGSGNLIVVGWDLSQAPAGTVISSITDNVGNVYAEAGAAQSSYSPAPNCCAIDIWYAKNSVSGATAITINPSASVTSAGVVIWEFAGVDRIAPLDVTAVLNNQPSTATPLSAAVTTTMANEVIVAIADVATQTDGIAAGNPFTNDAALFGNGFARLITSSAGTYSAQWNEIPAGTYASSAVAFKAASSAGLISGTPTAAGTSTVTLSAGNSGGTGNATLTLTIGVPAPAITSATSASGTVGSAFSYQITATNSPTSYSAAGLPAGLSVNTSTGLISGTPTSAATSTVTLGATNGSGTGSATLTLTIAASAAPTLTSATSASGTVGSAFSYQITATNSPTSYSATGLPAGLAVNTATGLISGTPTSAATSTVTLGAINAGGTGNASLTLTITVASPAITSATSASGTVGSAFSYQITATNLPTSYSATGLPTGLSVNTTTGLISGTPIGAGTSTVTLGATNAGGTGHATLTLTIAAAAPAITSATSASGTVGSAFSYQITATNSPTSYSATGLPAGLSVNTTTGLISGTPSAAGTSTVTLGATNAGGSGSATLTLTIAAAGAPAPVITSATAASGTAGSAFSYQITATNSPTSYSATGLPAGLSVNSATGLISGTPTAGGVSTVTLGATNAGGTGHATLTLTIAHIVTLSWAASSSPNIAGYNIYRGTTSLSGPFGATPVNPTLVTTSLSYIDTSVSAGTTYYYVATAVNTSGVQSGDSTPVSAAVP